MKKTLFAFAAVVAALVSCQKESLNENENVSNSNDGLVFTASIDAGMDTKTTLTPEKKVNWELGDEIIINGVVYTANPVSDAALAKIIKKNSSDADPIVPFNAFYPTGIQTGTTAGGILPATQTYAAGKITNLPMFATSDSTRLYFKNICAVLAVKVTSADIDILKAIKVKSDKAMYGEFTISDDKAVLTDASDSSKAVTLVSSKALTLDASGTTFYMAIPAQEYSFLEVYLSSDGTSFTQMMCTKKKSGLGAMASNSVYPIDYAANAVQLWSGGPFWATTNIGATSETDCGQHFAWGYTEGCVRNSSNDGWVLASDGTTAKQFNTTYFPYRETATYEDPATANWGIGWSVPTGEQLDTLANFDHYMTFGPKDYGKCSVSYVTTGVIGVRFTGTTSGYTSNSIFLPSAGCGRDSNLEDSFKGMYWSTEQTMNPTNSFMLHLFGYSEGKLLEQITMSGGDKAYGYSVRPVYHPSVQ